MSQTDNLGLYLADDDTQNFADYVKEQAGNGNGVETPLSNMQIVDQNIENLKHILETVTVETTDWNVLADKSPFTKYAEVIITTTLDTNTLVSIVGLDLMKQIGFGIVPVETISNQTLILYTITTPDTDLTFGLEIRNAELKEVV